MSSMRPDWLEGLWWRGARSEAVSPGARTHRKRKPSLAGLVLAKKNAGRFHPCDPFFRYHVFDAVPDTGKVLFYGD
jgi:hypothetical protein